MVNNPSQKMIHYRVHQFSFLKTAWPVGSSTEATAWQSKDLSELQVVSEQHFYGGLAGGLHIMIGDP